jgi:hypothetical protein
MEYAEASYFHKARFAHIAAYEEHARLQASDLQRLAHLKRKGRPSQSRGARKGVMGHT